MYHYGDPYCWRNPAPVDNRWFIPLYTSWLARCLPPTVFNNQDSTGNLSWGGQESALDDVRPALNVIVAREAWCWIWGWLSVTNGYAKNDGFLKGIFTWISFSIIMFIVGIYMRNFRGCGPKMNPSRSLFVKRMLQSGGWLIFLWLKDF